MQQNTKLPNGRPPNGRSVRTLAGRLSVSAMNVLADVAASADAPAADRVRTAELILRHAIRPPTASSASAEKDT